ncbi:MAG: DHH family phosphoesterase [Candidatus Cloacimonetes bacterium]|nr:DHH family phosphoesterase [Candidatus Cloacimonadota bacterium]
MNRITQDILLAIDTAQNITITTHVNPDGDGFCAALALQRILQDLGKESIIYTDDDDLSRYAYLMDGSEVKTYSASLKPTIDLLFILDCNSYDRLGERSGLVKVATSTILLDHHVVENNPIKADIAYIEPAYVSVGAIIYELLKSQILALSEVNRKYVGDCIYTTILNDTNNFANANTNRAVYELSADLCDLGIKPHVLYKEYFLNHSAEEMRYVGETLATIELHFNRKVLTMVSTLEMMQRNKLNPDSVMNITRWVQGVNGLDAIVYFREDAAGLYKLSLRSVNLNVNRIAIRYGGGGHRQASGCTIEGNLEDIKALLLSDFEAALKEYEQHS